MAIEELVVMEEAFTLRSLRDKVSLRPPFNFVVEGERYQFVARVEDERVDEIGFNVLFVVYDYGRQKYVVINLERDDIAYLPARII